MRGRVILLSLYRWRQPSRPLMHASPLLDGFSFSPVTFWMTPSSILRVRPQPTPQKPQIVVTSRAPLALPFSDTFSIAVAIRLTPSRTGFPVAPDSNFHSRDCLDGGFRTLTGAVALFAYGSYRLSAVSNQSRTSRLTAES